MNKDLADYAVNYLEEKGASYEEARLEIHEGNGFMLKNGNPEVSGFEKSQGLGIRFLANNTLGFISINQLSKQIVKEQIDDSFKFTNKAAKIGEKINFSEEKAIVDSYEVKQKIALQDLNPDEKLSMLIDLDKKLADLAGRYLSLNDTLLTKYYINSEGTKINSVIPRVNLFYFLTINDGDKSIQRYQDFAASAGYEFLKNIDYESKILEEVKQLKNNLSRGVKAPNEKLDVVTSPEVTGIAVHESVGHPYEADRIFGREAAQAGESFINPSMINSRIGSELVTVIDDPTIKNSYGFYLYDDEGVKARPRILINKGLINEFLHDRETAHTMNLQSNGSSRANNYDVEPLIRMSNTVMQPGDYSEEELFEDVKNGVYLKSFMEWNIDDKRFQQKYVGNEAYLIKNGRIEEPVRNPALEITTSALYSSVDALGKEIQLFAGNCGKGEPMQGMPVYMGGPAMRLRNLRIG